MHIFVHIHRHICIYIYVYVEHIAHCVTFFNSCSAGFVYFFDRMVRICVCRFVIVCKMRRFCWYVYFVFGCVVMINAFLHCFFFLRQCMWAMQQRCDFSDRVRFSKNCVFAYTLWQSCIRIHLSVSVALFSILAFCCIRGLFAVLSLYQLLRLAICLVICVLRII